MIQRRHRLAAPALGLARWQRLVREANITRGALRDPSPLAKGLHGWGVAKW